MSNNFLPKNSAVGGIMWKNMEELDRPQMTIWRMRFACWMRYSTNTPSQYVILIAFRRQQWLSERASLLRYIHIARLVSLQNSI